MPRRLRCRSVNIVDRIWNPHLSDWRYRSIGHEIFNGWAIHGTTNHPHLLQGIWWQEGEYSFSLV
ncbi:hypothetical protein E2C01_058151 [Portunus trituberculatus]|uniref:Uncharacterized protein n=1 Tax=Portunus trituberculatus TaxID=210409 RepID=A0A5B7GUU2_PORTR|nr:hypothetical protein [Portunus trituberculatus]